MQNHFMSPEMFKKIIYEHYLFDIPKLLDLCALYGSGNGPLLSKMVANVFERQPQYQEDWKAMVDVIMETLSQQALQVQGGVASKGAVRLDKSSRCERKGCGLSGAVNSIVDAASPVLSFPILFSSLLTFLDLFVASWRSIHQPPSALQWKGSSLGLWASMRQR